VGNTNDAHGDRKSKQKGKFGLQCLTRDGTYKARVFEHGVARAWIDVQGVGDKSPDAASVLKAVREKYGLVEK
jgi:hypothetical protein